ncbi:MAG: hypothetical protein QXI84_10480 [Thermofilaceae archaeon]
MLQIGTGEIVVAVLIAVVTAFYVMISRHMKRMEKSDGELVELMREYLYRQNYETQQQNPQWAPQPPQEQKTQDVQEQPRPKPRYRLYDEDAAADVAATRQHFATRQAEPPPFPYGIDVFARVLTCPKCKFERGEVVPLMILHRGEGGYTLTCGRQDANGRLHLFKLIDASHSVSPVIEPSAVVDVLTSAPPMPPKKRKSKEVDEKQEEE